MYNREDWTKVVIIFILKCPVLMSYMACINAVLGWERTFHSLSAKVRRLYDIANILSSLQLIEKVHIHSIQTGRKPGFRWIGIDPDKLELLIPNTQGTLWLNFILKLLVLEKKLHQNSMSLGDQFINTVLSAHYECWNVIFPLHVACSLV